MKNLFLPFLSLLLATPALAGQSPKETVPLEPTKPSDPWVFSLGIPGWLAATSGTIGLDGHDAHIYLGADTLIKDLDMIATFTLDVRKGRFGFYSDFLYVSASDGIGNEGLVEKLAVRLDQYLIDMDLYFRVLEGPRGFLDLRAGVRYTNIFNKVAISPGDEEIDRASTALVNDVGNRVRGRLDELDLRGKLRTSLAGKLDPLLGNRPVLPIAPLGARRPGVVDDIVRAAIDRRVNALADALRAERAAASERLREEARSRINAIKKRIANDIASQLKESLDTTFSLDEQWWDPYVGLRGQWNLNKAFYLKATGDIGGFGVGSNLTWQAYGALGCHITRSIYAEAGYRYLYTDYDKDNFTYKVTQSGVEITAGITF